MTVTDDSKLEAAGQVAAWLRFTVHDVQGLPSRALYEHFVEHWTTVQDAGSAAPLSETMWGRTLNEMGYPARRVASGKRRPLRIRPGSPGQPSTVTTNPSPPFSQVNPSDSFADDGLEGFSGPPTYKTPTFTTNAWSGSSAVLGSTFTESPDASSDAGVLESTNPSSPSRLSWPDDPVWAARWQAKLDAARTPAERSDVGYRVLCAAVKKARKAGLDPADEDALYEQVAAWLVSLASDRSSELPQVDSPLKGAATPAQKAQMHSTDQSGVINVSRLCPCDYCVSFWADLDGEPS